MRSKLLQFTLAFLALVGFNQTFAGGGPDAFGYVWKDSNDPGGPTYGWVDITGMGTQITGLADDNAVGPFALGWNFHYYWTDESNVKVGSNGWLSFLNTGNIAHCFPTIPSPGGNADNYLAPFMSDLNFAGATNPGEVWFWTNNSDTAIFSFINAPWWRNQVPDFAGSNTFQVILSGVDSSITFNYMDTDQAVADFTNPCAADLEIGIENITGNIGLEVFNEVLPADLYSVKFYYPAVVGIAIKDPNPKWNANTENQGQFVLTGANVDLTCGVANSGNTDVTNTTVATAKVRTLALAQIYTATANVDTLLSGQVKTVTFSPAALFAAAGQYYYEVQTANAQDLNPSNNTNTVEISAVAIDTSGNMCMSYSTLNPPDGSIQWQGGNGDDGVGVKIIPPGYPVDINSVEMYIVQGAFNIANNGGYRVQILDDDGPNGTAGTILSSTVVPKGSYTPETWVQTAVNPPVTVTSGAFYVAWMMGIDSAGTDADSCAIGTEAFGPISRRSFEILGGSWAQYRNNTVEDFLITVCTDASLLVGVDGPKVDNNSLGLIAFPNPTNGNTTVRFSISGNSQTTIKVMDLNGRQVFSSSAKMPAGSNEVQLDVTDFNNGIYILSVENNGLVQTRKLVVTK